MFRLTEVKLGVVKAKTPLSIEFPYDGIKVITQTTSPCDCAVPKNNPEQKKMIVKYTPKPVPVHLKQLGKGSYTTEKQIFVYYIAEDGEQKSQVLTIKATITD